jgi:peptidoglycan L-alanyl-D-glutamate endopeptidase CwlK
MNLFQFFKDLLRSKTRVDTVESRSAGLLIQTVPGVRMEIDKRSACHIAELDPHFQDNARQFLGAAKVVAAEFGCDYIIISGTRTWAEQNALYDQGRYKAGKVVTKAKAGHSNHNFGIAFDCGVFRLGQYCDELNPHLASRVHRACAKLAAEHGLAWGGAWAFKDEPHYQLASVPATPTDAMRVAYQKHGSIFTA